MNFLSLAVIAALGALAVYLAARMTFAIFGNFHTGRQFRRALVERAQRLRLMRMLQRRGIDPQEYLHHDSIINIEKQLRACEACDTTKACDSAIASRSGDVELSFCANDGSFERYQKRVVPIVSTNTPSK
jgi:Family of unknown function (DUF6455)